MIIRANKCPSFEIGKRGSTSVLLKPKVFINGDISKSVDLGQSFQNYGRWLNCEMDNQGEKELLIEISSQVLNQIDSLPLYSKNRILLSSCYLMSKRSWHLTIADIEQAWVTNQLDSVPHAYIQRWLKIPAFGTLSTIML